MTRTTAREIAVHLVFQLIFSESTAEELLEKAMAREAFSRLEDETPLYAEFPGKKQEEYISYLVKGVYEHCPELDDYISKYAVGWSHARISNMAVAIMRVAMYEALYRQDVPHAVAINEAVELTKRYESEDVVSFVNGILGSFVRNETPPDRDPIS